MRNGSSKAITHSEEQEHLAWTAPIECNRTGYSLSLVDTHAHTHGSPPLTNVIVKKMADRRNETAERGEPLAAIVLRLRFSIIKGVRQLSISSTQHQRCRQNASSHVYIGLSVWSGITVSMVFYGKVYLLYICLFTHVTRSLQSDADIQEDNMF